MNPGVIEEKKHTLISFPVRTDKNHRYTEKEGKEKKSKYRKNGGKEEKGEFGREE